jgi:penicillin V acylase-like amidase (Ntn superfamily)
MYELGSYNKFCTSITVQVTNDDYFLARNLDYGYQ